MWNLKIGTGGSGNAKLANVTRSAESFEENRYQLQQWEKFRSMHPADYFAQVGIKVDGATVGTASQDEAEVRS